MDRSRRTTHRRRTLGGSASPASASEASFDLNSSTSPVANHINTTPQSTQSGAGGRRSTKPLQRAFTFSPPGPSRGLGLRKRSSAMENYHHHADDDEDGPKKGGHSLRKRARVDYTFEHIDDDVVVPNSSSSVRGKKRRPDVNFEPEDFFGTDSKRRGASMGVDTPSTRRRNPSRKSSEMKAYREEAYREALEDDNDVQDTIEVGVSFSDVEGDEQDFHEPSWSDQSSPHSAKSPPKSDPVAPPSDSNRQSRPTIKSIQFRQSTVSDFFSKEPRTPKESTEPTRSKDSTEPAEPTQPAEPTEPVKPTESPKPAEPIRSTESTESKELEESQSQKAEQPAEQQPSEPDKVEPKPEVSLREPTPPPPVVETNAEPLSATVAVNGNVADSSASGPSQPSIEQPLNGNIRSSPEPIIQEKPESPKILKKEPEDEINHDIPVSPRHVINEDKMDISPIEEPPKDIEMAETTSEPQVTEEPQHEMPVSVSHITETTNDAASSPKPSVEDSEQSHSAPIEDSRIDESANPPPQLADVAEPTESSQPPIVTKEERPRLSSPAEISTPVPSLPTETKASLPSAQLEPKSSPRKAAPVRSILSKPQPAPVGRWSNLTPYVDGEFVLYPERKGRMEDDAVDEPTPESKDNDREGIEMEPMVEDNDDNADAVAPEAPTPALNTPTRGSPVPESADPTAFNSPAPGGDDGDDDVSESQEPPERRRYFKYRKLRDPEEYISAIENYEDMSTTELYEILEAINVSLVQWQHEWTGLGKVVDDYENSLRRRAADAKYESRTRNLHQHGINYEEPDFGVKGYKAKEREGMNETRYLQSQDRIMAATYGFEYDPHPSKIGRQNPETQQVGIMTRGRSLRNQPRQTAKATETEEVVGKRQRKPVQLFDPTMQDVSRSSTPVPTRGRRRKNADDDVQSNPNASFNTDVGSDGESGLPKTRRRRGPRGKSGVPSIVEETLPDQDEDDSMLNDEPTKPIRRGRGRPRYEEVDPNDFGDEEPEPELKQPRRHLLTLKIPKGKNLSEPSSAITDNGDSRPSTASSEESSHTAESSYSFRPKRQKRFRDDPDGSEETSQAPAKKRGKRTKPPGPPIETPAASTTGPTSEPSQTPNNRKVQKIKVVRSDGRNGNPSEDVEEPQKDPQKDYKSMTKSEKMSASMKNRWANGNMAGAVEKRKATLAAKKAAQAAAEQKLGIIAPKPKGKAGAKKDATMQMQHPHPHPHQQIHLQQPPPHPHQQYHPQHPPHPQHPQQHPLHPGANPPYVHGAPPNMGYPYHQM